METMEIVSGMPMTGDRRTLVGFQFTDIDGRSSVVRRMHAVLSCIVTAGDGHRIYSLIAQMRKIKPMA
jgi:hypothetical protein